MSQAHDEGSTKPVGRTPDAPVREPDAVSMRETSAAYDALAYVLAGPTTFGLIGWAVASWTGLSWALPIGILGGMALSLYYVWFRYGTQ